MSLLREWIEGGPPRLIDGAVGTVLYSRGVFVNQCFDHLALTDPDTVLAVHADYVRAGAELIETNTFGANPVKLEMFGLEKLTEDMNARSAELARRAAGGRPVAVLGAVGPLGIRMEPLGPTSRSEVRAFFRTQIGALANGGVDGIILETFADPNEISEAIAAARQAASDLPVIAQMSFGEEGYTEFGTEAAEAVPVLEKGDVVGVNCSVGPSPMLLTVEKIVSLSRLPVAALPNAGLPRDVGDRKIYLASPEYMARCAVRMVQAGARFVGGCCGTTPEHTRMMAAHLAPLRERRGGKAGRSTTTAVPVDGSREPAVGRAGEGSAGHRAAARTTVLAERSALGAKLAAGEFARLARVSSPRGADASGLMAAGRALARASSGVDAVVVSDPPEKRSRMATLAACAVLERGTGIETVAQYGCRDRNLSGIIGDLLGAAASGLKNLFVVTGDPPREGPYDSGGVYDIDSIGLVNLVAGLNAGRDPGGGDIGSASRFLIAVAANPCAVDPDEEERRLVWKVEAGADCAITPPVFDAERFLKFAETTRDPGIPLLAGLRPLANLAEAEFLANEVPGISVPDAVVRRMARASHEGRAGAEGIAIAREVLHDIRDAAAGAVVFAGAGSVEGAVEGVLD